MATWESRLFPGVTTVVLAEHTALAAAIVQRQIYLVGAAVGANAVGWLSADSPDLSLTPGETTS